MVYLNPKIKKKKFEDKISELSAEVNKKSQELGDVEETVSSAKINVDNATKELSTINSIIGKNKDELVSLEQRILNKKKELNDIISTNENTIASYREEIKSITSAVDVLKDTEIKLEKKKEELSIVTHDCDKAELALFETNTKRREIENSIAAKFKVVVIREDAVDKKEKEINDKIHKNGIILTSTEVNLRNLEQYVKRLQRHYDEQKININILAEFGIKRDNT